MSNNIEDLLEKAKTEIYEIEVPERFDRSVKQVLRREIKSKRILHFSKKIQVAFISIIMILFMFGFGYSYDSFASVVNNDIEKRIDYENFKSLNLTKETIIFEKEFYYNDNEDYTNWYDVLYQNQDLFYKIQQKYNDKVISFDDSSVIYKNGESSYLKIIYNDNKNPIITKEVPIYYRDITQNIDGSPSNITLRKNFTTGQNYNKYQIDFETLSYDYYHIEIKRHTFVDSEYIYHSHFEKYTGPKTYYIDDVPVVRIWKDSLGYRVDILNSGETILNSENTTKYYVVKRDSTIASRAWFRTKENIFFTHSDYINPATFERENYNINYIKYDYLKDELLLKLHIDNTQETLDLEKMFTLDDYYTQFLQDSRLMYDIELTRINQETINITFIHKTKNIKYSYSFDANE